MAYDEDLSDRLRELIGSEPGVSERRMFGGLCFLINDHLTIAASSQGGLLVRVGPEAGDKLIAAGRAEPMEMRGRQMRGYLRVAADDVRTKRQLEPWVKRSVAFVRDLPPKKPKKPRRAKP